MIVNELKLETGRAYQSVLFFFRKNVPYLKTHTIVKLFAGVIVLISALLVWLVSKWWLLFTAFIGVNLIQSAFTGFCPPGMLMKKLGMKE